MSFIQADNRYRPRRLSKKAKARMKEQKALERQRKREREDSIRNAKTFTPSIGPAFRRGDVSHIKSVTPTPVKQATEQPVLSAEMQERERIAQAEIERKKKCTAPAYNKGAYQYVASEEVAKDVGR